MQIDTTQVSEQITLFKRSDHIVQNWQARLLIKDEDGKNKYKVITTGTVDYETAVKVAYKELIGNEALIARGVPVFGTKFHKVWEEYMEDQQYQVSVGTLSETRYQSKRNMTNRWIRTRFADRYVHSINDEDMRDYWQWRINFADTEEAKGALKSNGAKYFAKNPKPVTLHEEAMVISQIFRFAVMKKYMRTENLPDLSAPVKWETNRRFPFDNKEMKGIYKAINEKIRKARSVKIKLAWIRLRYKVIIMRNTGMRPTEAINLKWGDYTHWYKAEDDKFYTNVFVHGKGKSRRFVAIKKIGTWLDQYKKILNEHGDKYLSNSDFVFHKEDGSESRRDGDNLKTILVNTDLLLDELGGNRTLYSFRHTYATTRLIDGNVDWELLSMNMGTSVAMLRDHYGHVIPQQKAAEITFSSEYELQQKKREETAQKAAMEAENVISLDVGKS